MVKKKTIKKKKQSRAKYKRPPELEKVIEEVNCLPPNSVLPEWEQFFEEQTKETISQEDLVIFQEIEKKGINYVVEDLLKELNSVMTEENLTELARTKPNEFEQINDLFKQFGITFDEHLFDRYYKEINESHIISRSISGITKNTPGIYDRKPIEDLALMSVQVTDIIAFNRELYEEKKAITVKTAGITHSKAIEFLKYLQFKIYLEGLVLSYKNLDGIYQKRRMLLSIIKFRANEEKRKKAFQKIQQYIGKKADKDFDSNLPAHIETIKFESNLGIEGTTIKVVSNDFFQAINELDADRIRLCEICPNIFWANRDDSKTCSKKCANTFRVRRYRSLSDEEKAERKAKRKANRQHKQKLKEMRKNKNGNL